MDIARTAAVSAGIRRLPLDAQLSQPWRIHQVARGFRLEDVWALPVGGAAVDEFPRLVRRRT